MIIYPQLTGHTPHGVLAILILLIGESIALYSDLCLAVSTVCSTLASYISVFSIVSISSTDNSICKHRQYYVSVRDTDHSQGLLWTHIYFCAKNCHFEVKN